MGPARRARKGSACRPLSLCFCATLGPGFPEHLNMQDRDRADAARLEDIELKLAFLERSNQELSDVVYAQQQALDMLQGRLARLADRLEALEQRPREYASAEEAPPHY